ncbi:BZ3500_MvSof-1268-A1-R1_Chr3-1g05790 [Microbotryum saponariae]|uniref:BZ3500_MvSof-1268-A1-R1_Chr3-1g05790 protein n=1 Tax=Microbotryum saponariae TaxID=289078 RepID=A0A2X0LIG6_9BASI|nr:BZ3500_MvSof-1268-A1-R1_Chr3-1g05790 [Microbotryum saponariae]SDA04980.1 BZ3501_MvSof-1269-A2-R1_Chr3-1g05460 [Microbotryum saponariae]
MTALRTRRGRARRRSSPESDSESDYIRRSPASLLGLVATTTVGNVGLTNALAIGRPIPTEASIPKNSTNPFPHVYGSQGCPPYVRGPHRVSQKCASGNDCDPPHVESIKDRSARHPIAYTFFPYTSFSYRSCRACYQKHQCRRSEITHDGHHGPKGPVGIGEMPGRKDPP